MENKNQITCSDLRIGNWVLESTNGFPMQVELIGKDYVHLNFEGNEGDIWECDVKDIAPIPLTEELLVKNKFSVRDMIKGRYGNTYAIYYELDYIYCIQKDFHKQPSYFFGIEHTDSPFDEDENKLHIFAYEVKYLHQLQNIIHAMTGNELEVKL